MARKHKSARHGQRESYSENSENPRSRPTSVDMTQCKPGFAELRQAYLENQRAITGGPSLS